MKPLAMHYKHITRALCERFELSLLQLASIHQPLVLLGEDGLDLSLVGLSVELAGDNGELIDLKLGDDNIGVVKSAIDLRRSSITSNDEVVAVLGSLPENTLVLLRSVFGRLLGLLAVGFGGLVSLLLLLRQPGVFLLLLLRLLGSLLGLSLLFKPLLVLLCVLLLPELLDTLVRGEAVVNKLPQALVVLSLSLLAGVVVLALDVTLLVTALVIIWDILVQVLERSPAVEGVPEVVELLDLLLRAVLVAKAWDRLDLAEASLAVEDLIPQLVEALSLGLLLGWRLNIGVLIDGIVLATLDRVGKDLGGLLDALKKIVVLGAAGSSLLVWVVLQDLLAVGLLNLVLSGPPPVPGYAQNGVVILVL